MAPTVRRHARRLVESMPTAASSAIAPGAGMAHPSALSDQSSGVPPRGHAIAATSWPMIALSVGLGRIAADASSGFGR